MPSQPQPQPSKTAPKSVTPKSSSYRLSDADLQPVVKQGMEDAALGRAMDLRNQAQSKMQVNSGLNPELVAIAAEMATIYIKMGARKFRELLRAMMEDMGLSFAKAQPYARGAYNQVRDDMDLNGNDISGMDTSDEVLSQVKAMRDGPATAPEATPTADCWRSRRPIPLGTQIHHGSTAKPTPHKMPQADTET